MDLAIAQLLTTAATSLVSAMAGDGWEATKKAVLGLWHRGQPNHAPQIETELDDTRAELLAASGTEEPALIADLAAEWQGRLRRLVRADPELVSALRSMFDLEIPATQFGPTTHHGSGDINQSTGGITTVRLNGGAVDPKS